MKHRIYKKEKRRGDKIQIRLRDFSYHLIYEKEVDTSDIKGLTNVVKDLVNKGVPLNKAIMLATEFKEEEFW